MNAKSKKINFSREAFFHPANIGFLAISVFASWSVADLSMLSEITLSISLGMELIYLGIVPRLPRFKKMVRSKKMKLETEGKEKKLIFMQLGKEYQKKFLILKRLADLTKKNFKKMPYTSQGMLEAIHNKIGTLLTNYLNLLDYLQRYEFYADDVLEDRLKKEIESEKKQIEEATSPKLKHTKKRRLSILRKRLHKLNDAREKSLLCNTHLETIEDAVHYIYEQSMTMNNPKEIGFQLDTLLEEMEETAHIVENLDEDMGIMTDKQYDDFEFKSTYNTTTQSADKQRI